MAESKSNTNETTVETTEKQQSTLYYVYSVGCGFCKKADPVVDELISDGHEILKLDMAEQDNQKLVQELKTKYNKQCGTPLFIDASTGNAVCGFREKDVLEKWLDGEDIPAPPRPTGPMPKPPLYGSTNKEEIAWKKEYKKWVKDNKHMPDTWQKQQKSANQIIDAPRPKSDPPRPPMGPQMAQAPDEVFDKWGEEMKVWQEENKHLPGLQPVDQMVQNMKNRKNQMAAQAAGGAPGAPAAGGVVNNAQLNTLDAKVQALEVKLDRIISHFGVK